MYDLRLERHCYVCKEALPDWPYYREAIKAVVAVAGAEKYEICSCCGRRTAPDDARDAGYRRRFNRYARRQRAEREAEASQRAYWAARDERES